jgi:hypothetical protein
MLMLMLILIDLINKYSLSLQIQTLIQSDRKSVANMPHISFFNTYQMQWLYLLGAKNLLLN